MNPPGVSGADFAKALASWRSAVGAEWVLTADADLDPYRDSYSPLVDEPTERRASAVVAPNSVEQIQAVVRIANRYRIPLYPISTGKNLTYGGSAPAYSGSVILDLKRMNRILEVNEKNAYALVEPGVSYFDLYRYIREHKLRLWIDCPDPGWGSLIGNSLDHGAGYTNAPYRDHFEAHCGMEVVLANGELVRTGMGAMPNAGTWQQFRYGLGPMVDGLFTQSNFGIVTKMGFWLMPEPECALWLTAHAPHHDDGPAFIDTLAHLSYSDLISSQTLIDSPILGYPASPELLALRKKWDSSRIPALDDYAERHGQSFWSAPFALYGPPAVVRAKEASIRLAFDKIPGATVKEEAFVSFPASDEVIQHLGEQTRFGVPNLAYFSSRAAPGAPVLEGHMDFSPIVPFDGKTIVDAMNLFDRMVQEEGIAPLGGRALVYHLRAACMIYAIPVGKDRAANKRARNAFSRMMDAAAERGWGEYRIHPAFMDKGMNLYSFNNNSLLRLHERLKDAIDPQGILSAGRYGIWPKHLRRQS